MASFQTYFNISVMIVATASNIFHLLFMDKKKKKKEIKKTKDGTETLLDRMVRTTEKERASEIVSTTDDSQLQQSVTTIHKLRT